MDEQTQLLTEQDAADLLKVSVKTLQGWRQRRLGPPYVKISTRVRYDLADLTAFIAAAKVRPESEDGR